MKIKIGKCFGIIIFSFLGLIVFCSTSYASTIFTDNFNSYANGVLNGQGSWVTNSFNISVDDYTVFEGSKAVRMHQPNAGFLVAEKSGASLNDGLITIYMRKIIGGTFNPQVEVQLKEGANVVADMRSYLVYFTYLDGDSASYVDFGPFFFSNTWFALQIQWRSSDHKVRYNINGGAWTNWVAGADTWTTGLDTISIKTSGGVVFIDTIQENLINVKPKDPVLIIPGLLGTEMKNGDELLWADIIRMMNPLNTDSFMDPLRFNQNLAPADMGVYKNDIIKNPYNVYDYADGLINEFKNQGYVEGTGADATLFTFPYDWRYGVTGKYADGRTNVDLLAQKISEILQQTGADKVDVAAHSMGGLIVKKYVMDNPLANHIGKAVFVGVPNTGAPKAVKVLLQGDNFGVLGLNDSEMKKIAENMPASYDLLPSQQYYNQKGSFVETIDETQSNGFTNYIVKDLNYNETKSFLTADHNLNSQGLINAENLHTQSFDNYDMRTAGVELYAIDGCKTGTIGKVIERRVISVFGDKIYAMPKITPGDGTVPLESATNLPINAENKFYFLTGDHGKMLSQSGSRQKIVNLVSGSALPVSLESITQDIDKCRLDGRAISVFSPINIFITDQNGNRLGLAEDGSIINEIPGADFEIWGTHKFVFVPEDTGQVYTINLTGTGNGTFTLKAENIQNSQTAGAEVFSNLSVTTELAGQVNLSGGATTLSLIETPGAETEIIPPSATLDAEQSDDLIPPVSAAVPTGTAGQPGFFRSNVSVNITATDNESGVLSISYNLDNTGFQTIAGDTADINISAEGSHTISFFATDKAGNNETEKTINFTIDKTPPEAIIEFDPSIKDLKFTGKDNISPADKILIQDNDNVIILTDPAGNTTEITLSDKNRKNRMRAELLGLKYNGVKTALIGNRVKFYWSLDKKKNPVILYQQARAKNSYNITAVFDGADTKFDGRDSSGRILKVLPGLKTIKVSTNKGDLEWGW